VLGRDDIGALQAGRAADLIALRLERLAYAGALHDPLAAAVFCAPQGVDYSIINGRVVVDQGHLTTVDLRPIVERHNRISLQLVHGD
jgi:8-oxoguanine deaminase